MQERERSEVSGAGAPPAEGGGAGRIVARGLTRRFGAQLALAPLDLVVEPGITGLLGPNGSGKSTLMRILTGLVRPDAGSAEVDGLRLSGDGTAIRRRATYAPGELHLYGEMRGAQHLDWLLRGRAESARERARELAGELGLPLARRVRAYSHGMKRQLLFCAALAPAVRVRILDEPTDGLDPQKRGLVLDLLREDARAGRTILLSSHHLGEVDRACARLVFMNAGRLVADEHAAEVGERAARLLRVSYPAGADLERLARCLTLPGVEQVRRDGARLALTLVGRDPRPVLAALAALEDAPAPIALEHGSLSLADLYRDVYGVEAC